MTTLYIDRKDIELRAANGVVEVHEPAGRRGAIPLVGIDRVVLHGRVQLSTSVIGAFAQAGASVALLSGRHGRCMATCIGRAHNDVLRRIGQFDAFLDAAARERWSRTLVELKTKAQIRLLRRGQRRRPDKRRVLVRAIGQLEAALDRLSSSKAPASVATMLGIEGAAAKAYFGGYSALLPPALAFQGRRKRPPKDPVNACLSLGYTLLHFEGVAASHAAGLEPLLGLYHEPSYGRESLAADVIEPLRPHVDEWVWALFRERLLTEAGFRKADGAVLLGKHARRRFYERFAPLGKALRRLLRRELASVARNFEARGKALLAQRSLGGDKGAL